MPQSQEELEFAVMRIEALKLARQLALASRGRQERPKVPVCRCHIAVCDPAALLTTGRGGCVGCTPCDFSRRHRARVLCWWQKVLACV